MRFAISLLLLLAPVFAQEAPKQGGGQGRGGPPKNLKVLTPEQLRSGIMRQIATSLGVRCDHCHIAGDNASDENPKKLVARMMMSMTHEINGKFTDGKEHVTCYTCHRGKALPEMTPPAAQ